jgi:hypothetical protein
MTAVRKHPDGGRQACCFSKSPPSDGHFTRSMLRIRAAPHLGGDSENLAAQAGVRGRAWLPAVHCGSSARAPAGLMAAGYAAAWANGQAERQPRLAT